MNFYKFILVCFCYLLVVIAKDVKNFKKFRSDGKYLTVYSDVKKLLQSEIYGRKDLPIQKRVKRCGDYCPEAEQAAPPPTVKIQPIKIKKGKLKPAKLNKLRAKPVVVKKLKIQPVEVLEAEIKEISLRPVKLKKLKMLKVKKVKAQKANVKKLPPKTVYKFKLPKSQEWD